MVNKEISSFLVNEQEIHVVEYNNHDYISLTDLIRNFENKGMLINNWLQNKNTIDFLGVWEKIYNPSFNSMEFHRIKTEVGLNRFVMSTKLWNQRTNGIGIIAKTGRYNSGTYAHKDIAFEFCSWLSPEFKLYLITEFQKFKQIESKIENSEWSIRRTLAKAQYRIHTDAVKNFLIPPNISKQQEGFIYATEADILNVALFGMTAKEWKDKNPEIKSNIRESASIEQLVVLSSLESQNALLIQQGKNQPERLKTLNELAKNQMRSLLNNPSLEKLKDKPLLS